MMLGSLQFVAERVLNTIPVGLLVVACAWLILKLVGSHNSRTRFMVWFVALFVIALMPFAPIWHVGPTLAHQPTAEFTFPAWSAPALLALWGLVAFFAIARIIFGLARLQALRRASVPVSTELLDEHLLNTVCECQSIRPFELRVSSEIRVPTAIGFSTPAILLPAWSLDELSPEELSLIVLHEFAHLSRRDDWTNLAQKFIRAILFFHPAVLWVEKRLSLEREMACDEVVVATTGDAHSYAECLVSLAEKSFLRRSVALAQALIGRARETSLRVAHILRGGNAIASRRPRTAFVVAAAMLALSFFGLQNAPQFVNFQSSETAEVAEVESPVVPPSMIVPTKADIHRQSPKPTAKPVNKPVYAHVSDRRATNAPRVIPARMQQRAKQFLIVVQTTDYYQHGSGIVSVTQWRLLHVNLPPPNTNEQVPHRT
jgi:beta-lactamase regulating signal transducer with metallopeptidase domain